MFFQTLLVGALASLAVAQSTVLSFDRVPNPVTAGQPQAITYLTNDTTSPVSIILRKGASGNLDTIATLTDDATGGQYIWTPSNSLENDGDYALEIRQGTQVNYYGPFTLQGSTEEGSSSSSSSSSSATGTATSSSSRSGVTAPATYPAGNSTATAFGTGTAGTGSPITRNTTMNTATLRPTSTSSRTTAPSSSTPSDLQASATPSGAASSLMAGGSAIALVLGAVGAIVVG